MKPKLVLFFDALQKRAVSRKDFFKLCLLGFLSGIFYKSPLLASLPDKQLSFNGRRKKGLKGDFDLVAANGDDPFKTTVKAVEAMGGMGKFVKKDSVVLIKPNIGWASSPESGSCTNPQVVAALVELSFKAGAKRVNIFDIPCNNPKMSYATSGIGRAAFEKGANVYIPDDWDVIRAKFEYDSPMEGWPILRDAIECDTFINVPVLKHHGMTRLTLSMKNLMGVCAGNRASIHNEIGRKLVDLADFLNPELTVMDAFRVLIRNGPRGENENDIVEKKTILVSTDTSLVDCYACKLVGVDPSEVPYVSCAIERKFGITDIETASINYLKI
ncbi:MAG: DUF362 domain-containing protein [Candidatus Omnitrophota bacterium]|jgi:uncharacterized protein (DUF362 family)